MEQGVIIDPTELKVGDCVQYEEKNFGGYVIEVLNDISDDIFVQYQAEIIEPIHGFQKKGSTFTFGHSLKKENQSMVDVYYDWKVKKLGSPTSHIPISEDFSVKEFQNFVKSLAKKYDS